MTHKILLRFGAQAPGCFLSERQLGAAFKIGDSNLKTSHPWAEASVVVRTAARPHNKDCFYSETSLACVVVECQCFPTNTCLQCPTCVSIQEGHFYSPRLNQPRSWNSPQEWRRQADVFENRRGNNRHNHSTTVQLKGRDCTR